MLSKLTSNQKILLVSTGLILLISIPICVASILLFNSRSTQEPTPEPLLTIEYCGAKLEQICILSFGRSEGGDTIINLFVPNKVPDFYLQVNKLSGEVIYECEKNEDVESSAYCFGEALLLGEQIEIILISKDGDIPFATGKFSVAAILISSQPEDEDPPLSQTVTPDSAREMVSPTPTPKVLYPSYP